ncbi:aminoglycoside phosphotransferase family protein [Pseudoalteromonas sp. MMG010]|uniref:phosphotransferase enzyme family protein n=1 Tax=Pseudoalteromonas sp. MMG010 TaxID=2822685 RepID=UPI001B3A39CD|nr:aminoglycoside phosphotransferase family protein [Pseudoalteromonas sp. MMG010]MBQ4831647.1 aminoglycoside phosphotransferase family protein [Pseudoalteromonas sp. MMG010]
MNSTQTAIILAKQFGLSDALQASISPIGNGHINSTLLLKTPKHALVLQQLNNQVFPSLTSLVKNARLIEQHLSAKKAIGNYNLNIIRHIISCDENYLVEHNGGTWRALGLIEHTYSEDVVNNAEQAYTAANAFGQFAAALADFDAQQLHAVIPDFHNLAMRAQQFKNVVNSNAFNRVAQCQAEIDFCFEQFNLITELEAIEASLPVRVCHNDTKINNMLFCNHTDNASAVIDLDTCMSGYWLYDFGDMVRTFCSPEQEDSLNLTKVKIREDIFLALAKGYLAPLKGIITPQEKHSFWVGTKVMTFMIGLRFLTDYLDGDSYFSVKHKQHNLQRAQNQFALYRDILAKQNTLQALLSQL